MSENGHAGTWVSLQEAATRLGVTEGAVRRRIKKGRLEARMVPGPHGQQYQVSLVNGPGSVRAEPTLMETVEVVRNVRSSGDGRVAVDNSGHDGREMLRLIDLVEHQQQTIMELSGRVGYFQAQVEQMREQLALTVPQGEHVAPDPTPTVEASPMPTALPWWRRAWQWVRV